VTASPEQANYHICRHSLATNLIENGYDVRTFHQLLSQKDLRTTTMVHTRVLDHPGFAICEVSPMVSESPFRLVRAVLAAHFAAYLPDDWDIGRRRSFVGPVSLGCLIDVRRR
jgi:Phage integrase family